MLNEVERREIPNSFGKKTVFTIIAFAVFTFATNAQNVTIPDANFKAYLIGNSAINTNADSEIQESEASAFSGGILVQSSNISDLTGIEAFTSLTLLNCYNNLLTSLDISQNTELTTVWCNVNQLTSLNVTQNTLLTLLECDINQISSLDVTQNTLLTNFRCNGNLLTQLDITQNINLASLRCNDNQLTNLDAGQNASLTNLWCQNNSLINLNVANGNNTNMSNEGFDATGNLNLSCIQVDDESWSETNWMNLDASSSFSTDCTTGINDAERAEILIYPNPANSQITIADLQLPTSAAIIVDVTGKTVRTVSLTDNTVDVDGLKNGIYFLQIVTDKGVSNIRFIKEDL